MKAFLMTRDDTEPGETAGKNGGMTCVLTEREVSRVILQSHPKLHANQIHVKKEEQRQAVFSGY